MRVQALLSTTLMASTAMSLDDFMRFSCSELNVQRLDPLGSPGRIPSPYLHQIVGGNAFAAHMDPKLNLSAAASCTTCTYARDYSNYWTPVLFFRHRNGSYHRVPLKENVLLEGARGGMTVYLTAPVDARRVTAFKPGFRMLVGSPTLRTPNPTTAELKSISFRCHNTPWGPAAANSEPSRGFPSEPCPFGLRITASFPTCWDGRAVAIDSPDHKSHVAYPESGTFESSNWRCPDSHPVRIPQLLFETVWDTTVFNNKSSWTVDSNGKPTQPFVLSHGDDTGYGFYAEWVNGWEYQALQDAMDKFFGHCKGECAGLQRQSVEEANKCNQEAVVKEEIDGWLPALPGSV